MTKYCLKGLFIIVLVFGLLNSPACKSQFVWDPTGTWNFTIIYVVSQETCNESLTFTGSESSGAVFNYTICSNIASLTGVYTKITDYSLTITFNFISTGSPVEIKMTCTSSENNPNTLTGSGEFRVSGFLETNINLTAIKTTNLQ